MTVRQIVRSAAMILREDDVVIAADGENEQSDGDVTAFVKCVNLAAAELAGEFPALVTKTAVAENGIIGIDKFPDPPVTVRGVCKSMRAVAFSFDSRGIRVPFDGECVVTYTVAHIDRPLDGELTLGIGADGEMLAYLTARNYCLITGRMDEASIWDQRYNAELQSKRILRRAKMPRPRFE